MVLGVEDKDAREDEVRKVMEEAERKDIEKPLEEEQKPAMHVAPGQSDDLLQICELELLAEAESELRRGRGVADELCTDTENIEEVGPALFPA